LPRRETGRGANQNFPQRAGCFHGMSGMLADVEAADSLTPSKKGWGRRLSFLRRNWGRDAGLPKAT
jgi:hypothetical protein